MSMIRDMMPGFELFQPATAQDAVALLERYGDDAWALAGGLDTFDWLKDRIKRPRAVVDLGAIESLRGVRAAAGGGLEIGAMTTLTEVSRDASVKESYALLAKAAGLVATPQIRNQGTIGGNVCQDTRCWYYRGGWPCYRAGGNICYADTPASMNREHCVFGASRCVAVNPSDTAGALVALDASMVVLGRGGEKVVKAEEFFIGPAVDITRMTVLRPGEMLTAIRLPAEWAGAHYYFEKARDRQSWDFALVSVAAAMKVEGGTVRDVRLVANSVAPYPMRLKAAEAQVRGKTVDERVAQSAGDIAVRGARPLHQNSFKVPLMRNLVRRAVREATATTTA
ncbi:MAG TPA: xanthine dehydrogenase family protein subunit M [Thermoanaerobaculia bacterium]|jgi:xanthine dehydrogenase YagS FAD-binding subunit|nr:xanthine dehydrogenase family protein subunit M [Thermoanaerobaculia bacterium]